MTSFRTNRTKQGSYSTVAAALLAAVVGSGCDGSGGTAPQPRIPTEVLLSPDSAVLTEIGATASFSASVLDQDGDRIAGASVSWSTPDSAVAVVSNDGVVTAIRNGRSRVRARAAGLEATAPIVVAATPVAPNEITFVRGVGTEELFTMRSDGSNVSRIAVADGNWIGRISRHRWNPSGEVVVFVPRNDLWTVRADGTDQERFPSSSEGFEGLPAWSPDGASLAFVRLADGEGDGTQIWRSDADGSNQRRLADDRVWLGPVWSPGGDRIAYIANRGAEAPLMVMDADGSDPVILVDDVDRWDPAWSPDGSEIAFVGFGSTVYVVRADGTGLRELTPGERFNSHSLDDGPVWSPSGDRILYVTGNALQMDIRSINPDGTDAQDLATAAGRNYAPRWSSDGSRILFMSSRDGNDEVYVMASDGSGQTNLTRSPNFDERLPAWGPAR